jgi:FMN phosphatase YigB (HAD superfamily)
MRPRYRALSLDLWFTTLSFTPREEQGWRRSRERVLQELLRTSRGEPFDISEIRAAIREVRRTGVTGTPGPDGVGPEAFLRKAREVLNGTLTCPLPEAARRYSAAGLEEFPPRVNPEAVELARRLARVPVPLISITNTSRSGRTWTDFFDRVGGPRFQWIITSGELGVAKPSPLIFQEASRQLGFPPHEILHVGDRWDLDVAGAEGAGFGVAIYRGLWPEYPTPEEREEMEKGGRDRPEVLRLDSLLELWTKVDWVP